jgi:hypothetical protein
MSPATDTLRDTLFRAVTILQRSLHKLNRDSHCWPGIKMRLSHGLTAACWLAAAGFAAASPTKRPNILFLITDDQDL